MYALFEDAGKFQTGRILSEAESSAQIELESGKRLKAKSANILLKFDKPSPNVLMAEATALSATIELDLAWEFAPSDEFSFQELAQEYFSNNATLAQQTAALISLFQAPHYFRRSGKGKFKKASADVLQQALAAIEKKKLIQQQIEAWALALGKGSCPEPIAAQLYKILFKPDKNAAEYKAVVEASRATHLAPLALLQKAGAITSAYEFHWQRFLFDHFPKGIGFPALEAPVIKNALPTSTAQAFSIDDSQTTEIDDALSVQGLGTGEVVVGIHIAAPALALTPGHAIDQIARQRLSTVYMPGNKITMLPDHVVQSYTLQAGRYCPAVSLYLRVDESTLDILGSETRVEQVFIAANLRHDMLDDVVTEAWLANPATVVPAGKDIPQMPHAQLVFLYRIAQHRKAQREVVRGKPENFNRPDYNFRVNTLDDQAPKGDERVEISQRHRGAPLDLMVAEAMILANSTWGQWLADLGVPGIYRSQASLLPGVKVRMGTKALPHAGIGVPCYAWSTSPLRRYTDLVNQWQIIACAQHGNTAAIAAPFKAKDVDLFSIISAFEAAYSSYNGYQSSMERFWTLQYLQQNAVEEVEATVFKSFEGEPPMARADNLPLVLPVIGSSNLARGTRVLLRIRGIDNISLDVHGQFIEVLQDAATLSGDITAQSQQDDDDETPAGPLAIAVDVDEVTTPEVPQS
ncbi:MAG: RNB domain-containing ribonuclease [Betaproteobacteria bacterium]|nr:RNB domain-containing ribonuclease [Betaproteobacteria bacterium]